MKTQELIDLLSTAQPDRIEKIVVAIPDLIAALESKKTHCHLCSDNPKFNQETIDALNEDTNDLPKFTNVPDLMDYLKDHHEHSWRCDRCHRTIEELKNDK